MAHENFEQYELPIASDPIIADGVNSPTGSPLIGTGNVPLQLEALGFAINNGGYLRSGMSDYNVGNGWWIGNKGGIGMFSFGSGASSVTWNGTTLNIGGTVNVTSLNIPDSTTSNSFHVDSSGNAWWGANVSDGISSSSAAITSAGAATFKNILIGGANIQYQVTNAGIFNFGDSSDGLATLDGSATPSGMSKSGSDYTMTRDVYYSDMTMSTGTTLNPAGYRIFGQGTLTMNGTAVIKRNGNGGGAGGNAGGSGGIAGTAGAGLSDGYLKGSVAGQAGGAGGHATASPGVSGGNTTNSIGANGATGSGGGSGGDAVININPKGSGAGGGSGGTATASNVKLIANWHLATLLDIGSTGSTIKFDNSAGSGGGGGGGGGADDGGGASGAGGGGGGSGSPGAIIAIYFRSIIIGASASITATGGAGGNGGNGSNGDNGVHQNGGGGGGGGGAGGNGGQVIVVYNLLTNSGTISAAGGATGAGGTFGTGYNNGVVGTGNTPGNAGTVRQFQVSL